ncbi:differentially expressed in FDCP 6 homolog [Sinocyclocheilus anshuiensis]|uniref:differentially expressed in FDCP 6 homolog n=1 Tax=Sinocyclocheilus anshuiensis TaxID=1608454 RepID=UPI0007BA460B|nr:PREDICTED: differentially expressed in FDCP 6 homolog [Sinocyclocheilus anshuiensis]
MERKSQALDEAQNQLDKVRASRRRVDQDIVAAQRKLRQASTSVKHWNVQMNRLMHPICPGERRASSSNLLALPVRIPSVSETESRPPPRPEREKQNSLDCDNNSGCDNMDCSNNENKEPTDAEAE